MKLPDLAWLIKFLEYRIKYCKNTEITEFYKQENIRLKKRYIELLEQEGYESQK